MYGGGFGSYSEMRVILLVELVLFSCIANENEFSVFNVVKNCFVN